MNQLRPLRSPTRRSVESYVLAAPVGMPTFRELLEDAPPGSWIALMHRSQSGTDSVARSRRYEVRLVVPSARRMERLEKFRGGIREWSALDRATQAISALLTQTGRANDLEVFIV